MCWSGWLIHLLVSKTNGEDRVRRRKYDLSWHYRFAVGGLFVLCIGTPRTVLMAAGGKKDATNYLNDYHLPDNINSSR